MPIYPIWLQMHNTLRELRLKKGLTLKEAGALLNTTDTQVLKLEKGDRRITLDWLTRIAKAYGVQIAEILNIDEQRTVKISGFINASGEVHMQETDQTVAVPATIAEEKNLIIMRLQENCGMMNAGWCICAVPLAMGEPMQGQALMVELEDGTLLMRRAHAGSKPGLWDLSLDDHSQKDARIKSAHKILYVIGG